MCAWVLCFLKFLVERADALLRNLALSAKIPVQIFRLIRFSFLTQVVQRPEKALRRVPVYLQRLLPRPFVTSEAQEDKAFPVRSYTKHARPVALLFAIQVVEPALKLFNESFIGCGIFARRERVWRLVFNYDATPD